MDISSSTLIFIGVVCITLGFLASLLLNTLSEGGEELNTEAPPGGKKGHYQLTARFWREHATNRLVVDVDGKAYQTTEALQPDQRQRLETLAMDLLAWLGKQPVNAVSQPLPVVPPLAPAERQRAAAPMPAAEPATGVPSIVTQINDILQEMLVRSPLVGQSIVISEDPVRGVVVAHNSNIYNGINAVPDGEVKQLLLAAVRQWEDSQ